MLVYGRVGSTAQKHLPEDLNPKIREQLQVQSHSAAICQSQCRVRARHWPRELLLTQCVLLRLPCVCLLRIHFVIQFKCFVPMD